MYTLLNIIIYMHSIYWYIYILYSRNRILVSNIKIFYCYITVSCNIISYTCTVYMLYRVSSDGIVHHDFSESNIYEFSNFVVCYYADKLSNTTDVIRI